MGQRDDDKLVRQLSLVAFLMAQQRPVTAEEIHDAVEGYGGMSEQAFLRRFYSDRSELEGVGLKLAVERPTDDPFQGDLYAMPPENYYLPPIEFDEAELSALHTSLYLLEGQFAYAEPLRLALQHLTLGRPSPLDDHAARTVAVNLLGSRHTSAVSGHLIKIESAISRRKTIRFRYYSIGRDDHGDREVNPYSLLYMAGNWYLVGYAHDREDLRCFRLSRIEGRITFKTRAEHDFPPPKDINLARYRDRSPWQLAEPTGTAVIALSSTIAWWVDQMFGQQGDFEGHDDGSAVFRTEYGGEHELISWVLGLGDEAEVLDPPALRDAVSAALDQLRIRHATKPRRRGRPLPRVADSPAPDDSQDDPSERVVPVERISRLLAFMTRLLAACGRSYEAEVPCSEIRSELNITQEALEEDLTLLNLINFGGGCYALFAQIEGDVVFVQKEVYGDQFSRPARLSPLEAKALLWALDFVGGRLPLVGEESLTSARRKIEAAVGYEASTGVELGAVQTASEAVGAVLARAVREDRVLEIDYWNESRGDVTRRVIEPHLLMNSRDAWYLVAYCRRAEEQRTFRLDRIRAATPLDEHFERRREIKAVPGRPWGLPDHAAPPHAHIATVWCSPVIARRMAEEHPSAERFPDGSAIIEIPYASDDWLVQEITKHAGEAVLHTPEALRVHIADRAERSLARYIPARARG